MIRGEEENFLQNLTFLRTEFDLLHLLKKITRRARGEGKVIEPGSTMSFETHETEQRYSTTYSIEERCEQSKH